MTRTESRWRGLAAPLSVIVLIAILGLSFLSRTDFFNPFDENSHFDYTVKIAQDLNLPPRDDTLGQVALEAWACSDALGFEGLECGASEQDPSKAPWNGANTAMRYFPSYYLVTGLATRVIHALPFDTTWLDAARIATTGWLLLLVALVFGVARRLGASTVLASTAALLVGSMPMVIVQGTSVNNDVAGAACALLAIWLWFRFSDSSTALRLTSSSAAALFAMTVKENAALAVVAVAALELTHQITVRPGPGNLKQVLVPPLSVLASVGFGYVLLLYVLDPLVRGAPSMEAEQLVAQVVLGAEPQDWGSASAKAYGFLLGGFQTSVYIPAFNGAWAQLIPVYASMLVFGALVYALLRSSRTWRAPNEQVLQQVALAFILLFPGLFLLYLKASGLPMVFQPRYYLPGLILGMTGIFLGISRKWSVVAMAGTGFVYGFMLVQVWSA